MRRLLLPPCLVLVLAAAMPAAASAQATGLTVTTRAASAIGQHTATVQGTVDPEDGVPTTWQFQYGTTSAYGLETEAVPLDSLDAPEDVEAALDALSSDTTYNYRLVAYPTGHPEQAVYGGNRRFHTIGLPGVATGSVRDTGAASTTLFGKVDPNRSPTKWWFEWGQTQAYGEQTPESDAGRGTSSVEVSSGVGGLAPFTTYHYRLVAINDAGIRRGGDHVFKTLRAPTSITIAGPAERVAFGGVTMIDGKVEGAGVGGVRVALEATPFPFTAPFAAAGNSVRAAADGSFHLVTLPLFVSSRMHVVTRTTPPVASPDFTAFAQLLVTARTRSVDARRYRIEGTVTPRVTGARVSVQRRSGGRWVFVHRTQTRRIGQGRAGWAVTVRRAPKARRYRVVVTPRTAAYARGISAPVKVPRAERRR